jgi:hypothetical protein
MAMDDEENRPKLPTADFPTLLSALQSCGPNDKDRASRIGVGTKTVERLRDRLPSAMYPFVKGPRAAELLRSLLADVERKAA